MNIRTLGNKNKGNENVAGLACKSQSHCFVDGFLLLETSYLRNDIYFGEKKSA